MGVVDEVGLLLPYMVVRRELFPLRCSVRTCLHRRQPYHGPNSRGIEWLYGAHEVNSTYSQSSWEQQPLMVLSELKLDGIF